MSAKAVTVALFVTKARKGVGVEVRVAPLRSVKNVWHEPDYPQPWCRVFNRKKVREMFSGARIFYNLDEAKEYALSVQRKAHVNTSEILHLDFSAVTFPGSDRKRARRHLQRPRR